MATRVDCPHQSHFPHFARRAKHIEHDSAIPNAKRMSSDVSAAHIDVESACQRHDGFDVGQDDDLIDKYTSALASIHSVADSDNM